MIGFVETSAKCTFLATALMAFGAFGLCGCSTFRNTHAEYATVVANPCRDEAEAAAHTKRAAQLIRRGKWDQAEKALQDALIADVTYGPAHNNLGYVYLAQEKLYLAAWEFEYAARLMPERPEPFFNLGTVYEAADQLDRAIDYYSQAYQIDPQNAQSIGNLARALLRRDDCAPEALPLLSDLLLYDTRPEWVRWARERLAVGKFAKPDPPSQATSLPVSSEVGEPLMQPEGLEGMEILPPGEIAITNAPNKANVETSEPASVDRQEPLQERKTRVLQGE